MKKLAVVLTIILLVALFSTSVISVSAGTVKTDYGATKKEASAKLDSENWDFTDKLAEDSDGNNYVYFGEKTTKNDRFISRQKIENLKEYGYTELLNLSTKITITKNSNFNKERADKCRFGVAFGMEYTLAELGEVSNEFPEMMFVYFEINTDGTLVLGIEKYVKNGKKVDVNTLFTSKTAATCNNTTVKGLLKTGENIILNVIANVDGDMTVTLAGTSVNAITVYEEKGVMMTTGIWGYLQTDTTGAKIKDFNMTSYKYVTPENTNIYEPFSANCYNAKTLYSQSANTYMKENYLAVKNNVLTFFNTANAFMSTKYVYSNTEVVFDVVNMRKHGEEVGDKYLPENAPFGIMLGASAYRELQTEYAIKIVFSHSGEDAVVTVSNKKGVITENKMPKRYNLWSTGLDGVVTSIRIYYVDGELTVGLRNGNEIGFTPVATWKMSKEEQVNAPDGYIRIFTEGVPTASGIYSSLGNMSIDNLSITNLDKDGILVESGFKSNVWVKEDYNYIDTWDDADLIK